jgi:hypothetical protein
MAPERIIEILSEEALLSALHPVQGGQASETAVAPLAAAGPVPTRVRLSATRRSGPRPPIEPVSQLRPAGGGRIGPLPANFPDRDAVSEGRWQRRATGPTVGLDTPRAAVPGRPFAAARSSPRRHREMHVCVESHPRVADEGDPTAADNSRCPGGWFRKAY